MVVAVKTAEILDSFKEQGIDKANIKIIHRGSAQVRMHNDNEKFCILKRSNVSQFLNQE